MLAGVLLLSFLPPEAAASPRLMGGLAWDHSVPKDSQSATFIAGHISAVSESEVSTLPPTDLPLFSIHGKQEAL